MTLVIDIAAAEEAAKLLYIRALKLLPDDITLPVLWLGLLANAAGLYTDLRSAVFGAVAGYMTGIGA